MWGRSDIWLQITVCRVQGELEKGETMIHQKTVCVDGVYKCTPSVKVQHFLGLPEYTGVLAMGQYPPVNSLGETEYPRRSLSSLGKFTPPCSEFHLLKTRT